MRLSLLSLLLLVSLSGQSQVVDIFIVDKLTQSPIPFAQVNICGNTYEANEEGKLKIDTDTSICEFTVFAFEYNILNGKIGLRGKKSLVFQLEPIVVEMQDFTLEAGRIKIKSGKDLVKQAIENFSETHRNTFSKFTIKDSTTFSIGNEEFYRKGHIYKFLTKKKELNQVEFERTVIKPETNERLAGLISGPNGSLMSQKIKEYSTDRTDILVDGDCNYSRNLECYFQSFFSTQRAISFNPFFSRPNQSRKLDHYGYFNSDFVESHKFQLSGMDTLDGRPTYRVSLSRNRKSKPISITGQGVKDWYEPIGLIWIDVEDLALVRMTYKYEFLSKPKMLGAPVDKAEFESGSVYFENVLEYRKVGDTYVPFRQNTNEKDRNLRIFYNDVFFESTYVQHFISFSFE